MFYGNSNGNNSLPFLWKRAIPFNIELGSLHNPILRGPFRKKERKKERKIYYAHDISIYKLSVEIIELKDYYIMMLYKLRLDVRSSVSFRVGYCI
jgi:hypothetical protein